MTNHWIDIRNADVIMVIGANPAENHPISFKWITRAMEREVKEGEEKTKLIHVDPRFTRTSSKADIYAPLRSGTDITFIGGMIRYVLNDMQQLGPEARKVKYNMTYLTQYTNAALIINAGYQGPDNTAHPGLFSGFADKSTQNGPGTLGSYNKSTWDYANTTTPASDAAVVNNTWTAWTDLDPKCVLKLLWEHYKRYDPDTVSSITGCPVDKFEEVCQAFAESGAAGKAGTICYAMGAAQHTYGTENIRAYSILQTLLANMGVAGGGINAMRGTSNVQGSTDMGLLSHILPGYLTVVSHTDQTLADYLLRVKAGKTREKPQGLAGDNSLSWWWNIADSADNMTSNYAKYIVSLLTAWYGKEITATESFKYLPKVTAGVDYTHIGTFEAMAAGTIKGMMIWGQNPAVAGPDAEGERKALENLEWLVLSDLFHTETSEFWHRPGVDDPTSIKTEVFLLPAAGSYEKQGTISNSGRWVQWRYKAVDPLGEAKNDLAIMDELMLKLQKLYGDDTNPLTPNREAITKLVWDYYTTGDYEHEADPNAVAKELGGYYTATGLPVAAFASLASDGSTACGNWLFCGMIDTDATKKDAATGLYYNKAKKRDTVDASLNQIGLYSNWAWCWPVNRRIIYNRASVDLKGVPFDTDHPVVKWVGPLATDWQGDVIDGGGKPISEATGVGTDTKNLPFIMNREGVARLWGTTLTDGPLPEAYEPWESPLDKNLLTGVINTGGRGTPGFNDPTCYVGYLNGRNPRGTSADYPCVGMTYRVTEHWQAGGMTRNSPWLNELQPQVFAELDEELAGEKGIVSGDKVRVSTARGYVNAVAIVTKRLQPLTIGGNKVHQVGVPWHWGYIGLSSAPDDHASGNLLTPHVGDANSTIPESKTFLCKIEKV